MENKTKLSTQPYKGTRDAYPEDMLVRNVLFDTWKKVAKKYGYEEYDTSSLEEVELYKAKSGEEIANTQLYNFTDKGGREIALRPEMTPSLARIIAAKQNELTLPIRWFNIGKYYRYEKPQRGRTREFFQLNIDIFGVPGVQAELEIIQFVMDTMKELKAPSNTYELKINNRYLLDYLFTNVLKLEDEKKSVVGRAIDNYPKMERGVFVEYLKEIGLSEDQTASVLDYLTWDLNKLKEIKDESKGAQQLLELFEKADILGITNISFNPSIMRGFLYYTGTVIEMFDIGSKENPRALFGGGRYDDLLEIFGKEKLPAFGLGWGDVTTEDYLRTYNLLPDLKTDTKVFVTLMDENLFANVNMIAKELRKNDINTLVQPEAIKLKSQMKFADKKQIPWVIVIGDEEVKTNTIQLKNMVDGTQQNITLDKAIELIKTK